MEDDVLEIDSPMEHPVDIGESDDELDFAGRQAAAAAARAASQDRTKMLEYPESLPYACETLDEFDQRLEFVARRLVQCVETKDLDVGLVQWNHKLSCLLSLKYPLLRSMRARLARLFYHVAVAPGTEPRIVEMAANTCITLIEPKKRIDIKDLVLPWRPLYRLLEKELSPKQRRGAVTAISDTLLDLAEYAQRFFDPSEENVMEMLREFLPKMEGSGLNSVIATQAFLVHFLPISHPQRWLPLMFRLWQSFSSSLFDDQMLDLLARLAQLHVSEPGTSSEAARAKVARNADVVEGLRGGGGSDGEGGASSEPGLWSEVGIFTEEQFAVIMSKCLRSAGLPVGSSKSANAALMAQSSATRSGIDATASSVTLQMKKPSDRLHSFATIIAYSISTDGPPSTSATTAPPTKAPTPAAPGTPTTDANGSVPLGAALPPSSTRTFLAGSKALEEVAKFIQATESFFHPSNWGMWQMQLASFIQHLTYEFVRRVKEEESATCATPVDRRITPEIRHAFCMTLRTVCLLSMFSKDPLTIASSQAALKRMAILEPDLILPAVVERAFSSLEALETTHRTTAIITALSQLSMPLVGVQGHAGAAKHLVPLLSLCLPGIDLNDPLKTMATSMFVLASSLTIKIDDLTRLGGAGEDEESDGEQLRMSTGGFEDWVVTFFRRTLALFEALPEEGKGGRTGGKSEENVTNTLIAACDTLCSSLSPHLFDLAWRVVLDHCLTTTSAQSVKVIGLLVSCFARADAGKVMSRLVATCTDRVIAELDNGASSSRTTSTSLPAASDTALHWNLSVLLGAISQAGPGLLRHRTDILRLLEAAVSRTKTERGYSMAGRLVGKVLSTLLGVYPIEQHPWNPDEWEGDGVRWGRLYEAKEVKIQWHLPNEDEIAFALEVIDRVSLPSLDIVAGLQQPGATRDKVWSNDFCRHLHVARQTFVVLAHVVEEPETGGGQPAMDVGDEVEDFIKPPARFRAGFILTDPSDPRHQRVTAFRARFGEVLLLAARNTQDSGAEDQIDCVKLLLRSVRTFMTTYAYSVDDYKMHSRSLSFFKNLGRLWHRQKMFPRAYWLRRALHYHTSRARLCSFHRRRTARDDELISHVLELCLSTYTRIRITAQNALTDIASFYDGTRSLCMPRLLEALRPGVPDDRVKGALYVLGSKGFCNLAVVDARFSAEYILALLAAQHHSKPSIQKAVRDNIGDFVARFAEPSTLRARVATPVLDEAAGLLRAAAGGPDEKGEVELLSQVTAKRQARTSRVDALDAELTPKVLAIAEDAATHWAFSLLAANLLRALIRKDKPLEETLARYFGTQATSENPKMRRYAQTALTKLLYFAKLRTLCADDDEALLLAEPRNPLKRKEQLPKPVSRAWAEERWASFAKGEAIESSTRLQDKDLTGWLVWGDEEEYYSAPPKSDYVFHWDGSSESALQAVRERVQAPSFWETFMQHCSQEKDRDYLSAESIGFVKSLFQVYGAALLPLARQHVEAFIGEKDRHKHRAAAEVISGILRGAKHWPLDAQSELWGWLEGLWPRIFRECTPDSQPSWQMCVEYILQQRDPRRAMPLVRYVVQLAKDSIGAESATVSPFEQAKAHNLLRGMFVALSVKFSSWAPEFAQLYADNIDHDFAEVRSVISSGLADLDLLQVHPSYGSVEALLDDAASGTNGTLLAPQRPEALRQRLARISADLTKWKEERIPTAQGTSRYDRAALTTLLWISITLGDHRKSILAEALLEAGFLPHLFAMLELHDNAELSRLARTVLTKLSTHTFDQRVVAPFVRRLLDIIRQSPSWRSRLDALPVLQVVYFQNLFYLDPALIQEIIELLCGLLRDQHLEVREMASTTLSGIVRCSQRQMIHTLRSRFVDVINRTRVPKRGQPNFNEALLQVHSGILGVSALLAAFPYEVPTWMPQLICDTMALHTDTPQPVSTTVRRSGADFKRTHQDTWTEDQSRFTPEQLQEVMDWTQGRSDSYYA